MNSLTEDIKQSLELIQAFGCDMVASLSLLKDYNRVAVAHAIKLLLLSEDSPRFAELTRPSVSDPHGPEEDFTEPLYRVGFSPETIAALEHITAYAEDQLRSPALQINPDYKKLGHDIEHCFGEYGCLVMQKTYFPKKRVVPFWRVTHPQPNNHFPPLYPAQFEVVMAAVRKAQANNDMDERQALTQICAEYLNANDVL